MKIEVRKFTYGIRFVKNAGCFELHFTNGKLTLISNEDIGILPDYYFGISKLEYVQCQLKSAMGSTRTFLHHVIAERSLGARPNGLVIDHINRDKRDNRRTNLRYITHQENIWNSETKRPGINKYQYVYYRPNTRNWYVEIKRPWRRLQKLGFPSDLAAHEWLTAQDLSWVNQLPDVP